MKKNSKIIIGTTSILATCALAFSVYEYQNKNNYNYNSTSNSEHIKINNEKEKKDAVVIAEISEFGYAVVHGDHTHFKHGLIPYDAKFLDSVVYKNKDYKLNKNDILYEVEQGYIIKINNKYYYYPNENIAQTNIITRELAEKITKDKLIITYCTTGVRASYVAVLLTELGYKVRNYEPSFARYANVGEVVI